MKRWFVVMAVLVGLLTATAPAHAKVVGISASPNPAGIGSTVRHTIEVGAYARLDVWVSASGFQAPGSGSLPPGAWTIECCPSQTGLTPAWHYRSSSPVAPGSYRFGSVARLRGTFLSTAAVSGVSASVRVTIG
jgi:hypothetical protein